MFERMKSKAKQKALKAGQKRSLEELFLVQRGPLVRFVMSRVKIQEEAEEIVQEAFIRYQQKYAEGDIPSPEALLARIASNLVIDKVREKTARATRETTWSKLHVAGADDAFITSDAIDPARILSAKQQVKEALEALEKLTDKTRQVFLLHRFEGMSHAEISDHTGFPKSTIEKHMIKAIKALALIKRRQ